MSDARPRLDATTIGQPAADVKAEAAEALRSVDTTALETLLEIRKQQTLVQGFHAKARDLKAQAADTVWHHVVDDYVNREAALAARASAVVAQVRVEYRKVQAIIERIQAAGAAARAEQQELQFRHLVGELADEDLEPRLQTPEKIIAQCASDLALVDGYRTKFVEALGPEASANTPEAPVVSVPLPHAGATPVATPSDGPTRPTPVLPASAAVPVADETNTLSPDLVASAMMPPADVTMPVPRGVAKAPTDGGPPPAVLRVTDETGRVVEFRLGALNSIGRAPENEIQLGHAGASRRHAVVKAVGVQFILTDLGSQNGTFVNGVRVKEHTLADGDHIAIGDAQVLYHVTGAAAPRHAS